MFMVIVLVAKALRIPVPSSRTPLDSRSVDSSRRGLPLPRPLCQCGCFRRRSFEAPWAKEGLEAARSRLNRRHNEGRARWNGRRQLLGHLGVRWRDDEQVEGATRAL
jgi:hypothetical protein